MNRYNQDFKVNNLFYFFPLESASNIFFPIFLSNLFGKTKYLLSQPCNTRLNTCRMFVIDLNHVNKTKYKSMRQSGYELLLPVSGTCFGIWNKKFQGLFM